VDEIPAEGLDVDEIPAEGLDVDEIPAEGLDGGQVRPQLRSERKTGRKKTI